MKIIVIESSKGGVGKTTTAVNISSVFSFNGIKTAIIDADNQGTSIEFCGAARKNAIGVMESEFILKSSKVDEYNEFTANRMLENYKGKLKSLEGMRNLVVDKVDLKGETNSASAIRVMEKYIDGYRHKGFQLLIFDMKGEHSPVNDFIRKRADLTILMTDNGLYSLRSVLRNVILPNKDNMSKSRVLYLNQHKGSEQDIAERQRFKDAIEGIVKPIGDISYMSVYRKNAEKGFGVVESFDNSPATKKAQNEINQLAIKINNILKGE
ncbi:TPA: AAA family ATPase [Pseudomonas aeruginosa]|nr:AAA family ATPase [Pseudomonas aeruginosa]